MGRAEPAGARHWARTNGAFNGSLLFEKFGQHQPLNRQAERYVREGVDLSLSTLADQVGACTVALDPIHALIKAHVMAAERLHGPSRRMHAFACRATDDTTVPLLAKGGTTTARLWTYVRDDRPFGGAAPPAALFYFSRDRGKEHPNRHLTGWQGILQADAYGGCNDLYRQDCKPGPVASALCWAHARRKFFELADIAGARHWARTNGAFNGSLRHGKPAHQISLVAFEAVKRIDAIFDIERDINGLDPKARLEVRTCLTAPLLTDLEAWLRSERAQMSRHNPVAKAINYLFEKDHWPAFTRFLTDGRACLTNNAAERSLRGTALGRKAWLFAGSDRGGDRTAFMYSLIVTAKMNNVDPQAWLADVLATMPALTVSRLPELLPWNWRDAPAKQKAA